MRGKLGACGGKHAAKCERRGKKTLKETYGEREKHTVEGERDAAEVRRENICAIGWELMKTDSSYPCFR